MDDLVAEEPKYVSVEKKALDILRAYTGNNNYLLILKNKINQNETILGRKTSEYVVKNHNKKVIGINKWYPIDGYCGEELQKKFLSVEKPTKLFIQKILAETDKAVHIWGKIWEEQKCVDLWIPRHSIIKPRAINQVSFPEDHWKIYNREPLPHQIPAIIKLLEYDRFILGDDMGVGKSYESIVAAIETKVEKILIVCPASLKLNWKKEIEILDTTSKIDIIDGSTWISGAKWTIVNYDILKNFHTVPDRRLKDQKLITTIVDEKFDLIIVDECFVYDTLVTTNRGQIKIGDIVENQLDVQILSYNLKTNDLEYKTINRYIKKETKTNLLRIKTHNGLFIDCTPNHKIYVKNKGYVRADQINKNNELFMLPKTINQTATNSEEQVLWQKMQRSNVCYAARSKTTVTRKCQSQMDQKNMSNMRDRIFNATWQSGSILYTKLFGQMENATTRYHQTNKHQINKRKTVNNLERYTQKTSRNSQNVVRTHETRQSNVETWYKRKNDSIQQRQNIFISRRKRSNNQTTTNNLRFINPNQQKLGFRISDKNQKSSTPISFPTKLLLTRYWGTRTQNSDRNRWKHAQNEKVEIFRPPQNRSVECFRVESVEILESRNRSESRINNQSNSTVYNLEIADNHNYFANNILVSNCHAVKHKESIRTKLVNDFTKGAKRLWLLTGTPITNRPIDLYNLLSLCNHRLARNWVGFVIRYCAGKQFYGKGGRKIWDTKGASYMDELRENTQDVILRRRKEDVLDLPEKIIQPIYLPLRNKLEYQKIVGEYQSWAEHQTTVNLAMHLAELVKLRQFLAMSKIESTIEIAENTIEEGKKVVIFTNFTEPLLQMFYHFGNRAVIHHGPMTKANREESIERFQNDPEVKVFIGNIVSAGIGITLTAGALVIFNDLSWLPADHLQAQDRCYRVGTTKIVNVYYNIIDESLDIHLYHHLMKKIKIIDQVMGDSNLDESIFQSVLQKLKK